MEGAGPAVPCSLAEKEEVGADEGVEGGRRLGSISDYYSIVSMLLSA